MRALLADITMESQPQTPAPFEVGKAKNVSEQNQLLQAENSKSMMSFPYKVIIKYANGSHNILSSPYQDLTQKKTCTRSFPMGNGAAQ